MIQNKFINGLAMGIVLPILAYPIFIALDKWIVTYDVINKLTGNHHILWAGFRFKTLVLFVICVNLIPTFFANRKRYEEFVRGIMIPTVIFCFIWFFRYGIKAL